MADLPQSPALSEASADSISDLFSRDPESASDADWARLVDELRKARAQWVAGGMEQLAKRASAKKVEKAKGLLKSAEEMGL